MNKEARKQRDELIKKEQSHGVGAKRRSVEYSPYSRLDTRSRLKTSKKFKKADLSPKIKNRALYTPSGKVNKFLSNKGWLPNKAIDPRIQMRVNKLVQQKLDDTNPGNECESENVIDYDTLVNKDFNIDAYKREPREENFIDSEHKVIINTLFDRRKVKEAHIPVEVLFNPKVDQLKAEERHFNYKPSKVLKLGILFILILHRERAVYDH